MAGLPAVMKTLCNKHGAQWSTACDECESKAPESERGPQNRAQTLGQWSKEHLESLRQAAQVAEQHERELLLKLAEVAECYSVVKRAC